MQLKFRQHFQDKRYQILLPRKQGSKEQKQTSQIMYHLAEKKESLNSKKKKNN
jgi:hypothetical protein